MRRVLNIFYFFFVGVLLFACKKDYSDEKENLAEKKFVLELIHTDEPVDLNFDGVSSQDLFDEIPSLKNSVMLLDGEKERINIIWQEPEYNKEGIGIIPSNYTKGTKVVYYPVQNPYTVKIKGEVILPTNRLGNHNMTLNFPSRIVLENENRLSFITTLKILTFEGPSTISINCTYKEIL